MQNHADRGGRSGDRGRRNGHVAVKLPILVPILSGEKIVGVQPVFACLRLPDLSQKRRRHVLPGRCLVVIDGIALIFLVQSVNIPLVKSPHRLRRRRGLCRHAQWREQSERGEEQCKEYNSSHSLPPIICRYTMTTY